MSGNKGREVYIQGHPEYASDALRKEYSRDQHADRFGLNAPFPVGYFPGEDITSTPKNHWRATGTVFFHNWVNFIYQTTHFDLRRQAME